MGKSIFDGLENSFLNALAAAGEALASVRPSPEKPQNPLDEKTMTPRMFSTLVQAADKEGAREFLTRAVQRLARTTKRVDVLFGEAQELVQKASEKVDKGNALVTGINQLVETLQELDPEAYTDLSYREPAELTAFIPGYEEPVSPPAPDDDVLMPAAPEKL